MIFNKLNGRSFICQAKASQEPKAKMRLRLKKSALLLLLGLLSNSLTWASEASLAELATSPAWLNLLYYVKEGSHFKSRVTREEFFLHAKGQHDPHLELAQFVEFVREQKVIQNEPVECLFPARYAWASKHIALPESRLCKQFSQWMHSYRPSGLKILYASQYISNPASVFGHSLLLVPSHTQTQSLWLTYNFAAGIPKETSGFGYIYGGLTGWFKGDYSILPFYQRLYKYGNVENRDLWIYDIKLSEDELEFILKHFWELVHRAEFDYYFMDENCAGILLRTLNTLHWDTDDELYIPLYAHPVDVIKFLQSRGRLGEAELMPSHFRQLEKAIDQLSAEDQAQFYEVIGSPDSVPEDLSPELFETLIYYTTYRTHMNSGQLPNHLKNLERHVYLARAQVNKKPQILLDQGLIKTQAPHLSHKSMFIQPGLSSVKSQTTADLSYRFAIHDILDPEPGYLKNSSIEGLHLTLSATEDNVWFKQIILAKLENYRNLRAFDPKISWKTNLEFKENLLTSSESDLFFHWNSGSGLTFDGKSLFPYGMLNVDVNGGHNLPQSPIELGGEIGIIGSFDAFKAQAYYQTGEGFFLNSTNPYQRAGGKFRVLLSKEFAIMSHTHWERLIRKKLEGYRMDIGLRYYFSL